MYLRANLIRFLFKFPFPYVESELLFPMKIRKVRGTSSSNLPRSVDAWRKHQASLCRTIPSSEAVNLFHKLKNNLRVSNFLFFSHFFLLIGWIGIIHCYRFDTTFYVLLHYFCSLCLCVFDLRRLFTFLCFME